MKKYTLFICTLLACLATQAQTKMRIWQAGEDKVVSIAEAGEMKVDGSVISIKGKSYQMSAIDSIIIVPQVDIIYNEGTATVNIPAAVAKDVTATVNGAHVTINNKNVSNECEFVLSGSSSNGSLTYNGSYKTTFVLNGLSLKSANSAALDIQCGKRVAMNLMPGTANVLEDGASGSQKACLYCKGHLEVEGSGSLSITANKSHGIATKEYLQLKKSTGNITIVKSANDAIHAGQYFQMNGGTLTFDENTVADGVQVDALLLDDDVTIDPNEEFNGQVIIKGGTIKGVIKNQDCKGIKCDGAITISGGTIDLSANGNGSRGVQADGLVTINEKDNTTLITILAKGARCTLSECEDDPHRCVGMKLDGGLRVEAGTLTVTATGSKSRSIQVPVGGYTKTGGTVNATPGITEK